jgi:hypothetical protein
MEKSSKSNTISFAKILYWFAAFRAGKAEGNGSSQIIGLVVVVWSSGNAYVDNADDFTKPIASKPDCVRHVVSRPTL